MICSQGFLWALTLRVSGLAVDSAMRYTIHAGTERGSARLGPRLRAMWRRRGGCIASRRRLYVDGHSAGSTVERLLPLLRAMRRVTQDLTVRLPTAGSQLTPSENHGPSATPGTSRSPRPLMVPQTVPAHGTAPDWTASADDTERTRDPRGAMPKARSPGRDRIPARAGRTRHTRMRRRARAGRGESLDRPPPAR